MQSTRQPKWDWATHFDWMLGLYHNGATIPQIHKAILALECDTFRPCLRAVYDRFQTEGYDTSHDRGSKSNQSVSSANIEAGGTPVYQQQSPAALWEGIVPRAPICVPKGFPQKKALEVLGMQTLSPQSSGYVGDDLYSSQSSSQFQREIAGENLIAAQANLEFWNQPLNSDSLPPGDFKIPGLRDPKKPKVPSTQVLDQIERNFQDVGFMNKKPNPQQGGKAQHGGGRTRHPDRDKESRLIRKIRSLTSSGETKNSVSKSRANQVTSFTNRDSGFYSGCRTPSSRGAPSILHFRDSGVSQIDSLTEIKGPTSFSRGASSTLHFRDSGISQAVSLAEFTEPYRAVCQTLHEPKSPDQYRRMKPCIFCRYSNIHNLACVASNLRLREFEDELSFEFLYDFQALDAAGNTALHYAAASRASPGHLKALIDAGVPPYQQNTAKQNFLHCLRPRNTVLDGWDPDCLKVNLIQLLDLLELKVIFGQQDNNGQTVLHTLTSYITEPELKEQIINKFNGSGFRLDILDRFGRNAVVEREYRKNEETILEETDEDDFSILDDPPWWTETIDYPDGGGNDTMSTSLPDLEVSGASKWNNAYDAIVEALENPNCVDRMTNDTVLHALSRVNVQTKGSMRSSDIINFLRDFVSKGVNLNWHNGDGQTALTAFICNKHLRGSETGATMAKYIDILLWKDDDHVIHNDINVNMMNRRGATALYEAVVQAQSDSVRSLIEAGANVNARLSNDPRGPSVLQAAICARDATAPDDSVRHHMFAEVISHLEHAGAVVDPTSLEERGRFRERGRST